MNTLTNESGANQIVMAIEEIERFITEKKCKELLDDIKIQKLHLKSRLLFKGDRVVRKKYLFLWPEANSRLDDFKTSKIRKIILAQSIKSPIIAMFLLDILYFIKMITKRNLFLK